MAGMLDQLINIMGEQSERYEELLGLAKEKRDIIILNDIENLQKVTHLENLVISQSQKLERKRITVVSDIALVLNQKEDDLTLSKLIELMEGQEGQDKLIELKEKFKVVIEDLKEHNDQNTQLVQNALDYLDFNSNLIRGAMSNHSLYPGMDDNYPSEAGYIDTKN